MPTDNSTYNDGAALTSYIWHNYLHLLTDEEYLVHKALIGDAKAEHASPAMAKWLREKWGSCVDPAVSSALADGVDAFRDRVRDRILKERVNDVSVNRCPECSRVVVTPLARQCLWCGHDWH